MSISNISHVVLLSLITALLAISFTSKNVDSKSVSDVEIEQVNNIFASMHIDDIGVRTAITNDYGQKLDQEFIDKKNDIKVYFNVLMTDEKETKLLLTYQSDKKSLENYYIDLFEGESSINLFVEGKYIKSLDDIGWGSRYYDRKENKVIEALSFESIKEFSGKDSRLEIEDITIYEEKNRDSVEALWKLDFKIKQSAILNRESVDVHKEFNFEGETYKITRIEFSPLETRIVLKGSDISNIDGYEVLSELESQFLSARKIEAEKGYGYSVDYTKSGVFLNSNGKNIDPIFSKGEIPTDPGEYALVFGPVNERHGLILQVGDSIKIPL